VSKNNKLPNPDFEGRDWLISLKHFTELLLLLIIHTHISFCNYASIRAKQYQEEFPQKKERKQY